MRVKRSSGARRETIERSTARFALLVVVVFRRRETKKKACIKRQHAFARRLLPLSSATCQDRNAAATIGKGEHASFLQRLKSFEKQEFSQPRSARDEKKKKATRKWSTIIHPEPRESCSRLLSSLRCAPGVPDVDAQPPRLAMAFSKASKQERKQRVWMMPKKKKKKHSKEELKN